MTAKNRQEMLLLEGGQQLQLLLEVRKQTFTGFDGAVGRRKKFLEEIPRLVRRRLSQFSRGHDSLSRFG
jgi:hypothetical protein